MTTGADGMGAGWRGVGAAFCACLLSIGLARFAYGPLLPAMVDAGWFTASGAVYLAAANLGGYLIGAVAARALPSVGDPAGLLRGLMIAAAVSLFACMWPAFGWFLGWRLVSGVAGAMLMILAPPAVMAAVPPARRGLAGGVVFTGVGLGIAVSGIAVPALLRTGVAATWLALGVAGLLLTALAWRGWPHATPQAREAEARPAPASPALRLLFVQYALNAAGLVPHMLFLADYVARGLGRGVGAGGQVWAVFGLGAVAGPVLAGALADRLGAVAARRLGYVVQIGAIGLPAAAGGMAPAIISALVVGAAVPGVASLTLAGVRHLVAQPESQRRAWGTATIGFAIGQAAAGYAFSALLIATGRFSLLFALGALLVFAAVAIDLAGSRLARWTPRRTRQLPGGAQSN